MSPSPESWARRAALDRDGLGRVVDQLLAERAMIRAEADRLAASRAFRASHRAMRLLARTRGRRALEESALDLIRASVSGDVAPPDTAAEPWPWVQPVRHHVPSPAALRALESATPVTIVVPIHDAAQDLRRCLDSVKRQTTVPVRLVLVDDASTDPQVSAVLARHAGRQDVRLARHTAPRGFAATVNRGLEEAGDGDVVLLNSDTEVPPRWLQGLMLAAHSAPDVATATPLSNAAGPFTVAAPDGGTRLAAADFGRIVDRGSLRRYPRAPSGAGFCLYLKRAALDDVGPLDAARYPRGYGEENDWCMSAGRRGWAHVADDATYVFHRRGASFGTERAKLSAGAQATLARRHPEYSRSVRAFAASAPLGAVHADVRRALRGTPGSPGRCTLGVGDAEPEEPGGLRLEQAGTGVRLVQTGREAPWPLGEWEDAEEAAAAALAGYGVEAVGIGSTDGLGPAVAAAARALHLPRTGELAGDR